MVWEKKKCIMYREKIKRKGKDIRMPRGEIGENIKERKE